MSNTTTENAVRAERVLDIVIGEAQVDEAIKTLNAYKSGKANYDAQVVENEEWYRLRHWDYMRRKKAKGQQVEPSSAWLYNCLAQKHADMMDNFPEANILPREEADTEEAKRLSSIIPVILENTNFEDKYDDNSMTLLKDGANCYGVFWDPKMDNGLGDIDIRTISLLNIFTEPGVMDIQKSRNVFTVELVDNDLLIENYPFLAHKLTSAAVRPVEFVHDDSIDTTSKSAVIDWYYKKRNENGKTVLHYVKFVGNTVLYATENEKQPLYDNMGNVVAPAPAEVGLYDDGNYPFVITCFNEKQGSPFGFGLIDIGKSSQEWIDRGNAAIMKSMMVNAKPRYLVRQDCEINEAEFADTEKDIIHYTGVSPSDAATPVQTSPVNSIYVQVLQYKIDELKEVTGNREVSTGGREAGVTAASAIAALQEAAGKGSRDINKKCYRAFREMITMVIERIRQFYTIPRQFRIIGERGAMEFVLYSNEHLRMQQQTDEFGVKGGYRLPVMDVKVSAQKASPYTKMSQNELALELYTRGFFQPANADNALAALSMMDFDDKDKVAETISRNGTLIQSLVQMASIVDELKGTNFAAQIAAGAGIATPAGGSKNTAGENNSLGGDEKTRGEAKITRQAREKTAEASAPR